MGLHQCVRFFTEFLAEYEGGPANAQGSADADADKTTGNKGDGDNDAKGTDKSTLKQELRKDASEAAAAKLSSSLVCLVPDHGSSGRA